MRLTTTITIVTLTATDTTTEPRLEKTADGVDAGVGHAEVLLGEGGHDGREHVMPWLRTNGVNTNWAAAKVINFGRLGEKVHPGTFGRTKAG